MSREFTPWSHYKNSPGWTEDENGCHIWTGGNTNGYATANVKGKQRRVYRLRYEREIGPIPEGLELDHYVCDNGAGGCCNPHHCRPVTHRENILRSDAPPSLHAARTHCPHGHALEGDNLIRSRLVSRGSRECRACDLERKRRTHGGRVHNSEKTHCSRGHEFTDENVSPGGLKRGRRICLVCKRERRKEASQGAVE